MNVLQKISHNQKILVVATAFIVGLVSFGIAFALSTSKTTSRVRCEGTCVALHKNKAEPDTLTVKTGSFVQFNSADGKSHNLSLGKGGTAHSHTGMFHSGEFKANEAWRVQFKDEGSFFFHDHLNPKINMLIVVYTPGKDHTIH